MKKIILLLCLCLISSTGLAQNVKAIRVTSNNGECATFQLSNTLEMNLGSNELLITDGAQTISFELDDLKIEYFSDVSGIEQPVINQRFTMENNMLIVQGVEKNECVQVYHPSGIVLRTESPQCEDGMVCIPLSSIPLGVFIVRCGTLTLKYQRK